MFPKCNKAEIDWHMMMPADPPLVDPQVGKLIRHCEEGEVTLEPTFPLIVSFHIEMGRNVCWNKSNTMLVSQIQYVAD